MVPAREAPLAPPALAACSAAGSTDEAAQLAEARIPRLSQPQPLLRRLLQRQRQRA